MTNSGVFNFVTRLKAIEALQCRAQIDRINCLRCRQFAISLVRNINFSQ